jgi:cytochrome c oxidase assembly protein subunit 15
LIKQKSIAVVALCAFFFALCVIGLGAFTRLIDAGLGCPDWPGCYGHLTVPLVDQVAAYPDMHIVAYKAWVEMIHRYFAGTLSILILIIVGMVISNCIKSWREQKVNLLFALGIVGGSVNVGV